ncbi:M24 family metallopeptidase [Leptospira sp. 'Mane']|uniref:M24 family metallopeptidase n=1 Tax=Leptospira sp. 'Mane' TaxID=3387407 RepID=UPI00398AAF41
MSLNVFESVFHFSSKHLSSLSKDSAWLPTPEDLEGFRAAQNLAYSAAVAVSKELKPGITEKQAAKLLKTYLNDHGAKSFLHRPFAWFGDRSRFWNLGFYMRYLPSDRKLKEDDVYILDVSPVVNGYTGDIGYTSSLAPHPELAKAKAFLLELRKEIPGLFMKAKTPGEVWKLVNERVLEAGFANCHALYPFAVLGHRVYRKFPFAKFSSYLLPVSYVSWFSYQALLSFSRRGVFPETLTEEHRGEKLGLWAIEPHIGGNGFGAKFEEIIVVEKDRAYWLSDDVPHITETKRG